jgi:hypothetical protein
MNKTSYELVTEQLWKEKLRSVHHQLFDFSDSRMRYQLRYELFQRFDRGNERYKDSLAMLNSRLFFVPDYKDVMQYVYGKVNNICLIPAFIIRREAMDTLFAD